MRKINYIVVHCTATQQSASIESIKNYWKNVLNWKSVGYHMIIDTNGYINQLASYESITNGVAGHNKDSIHIAYLGGIDEKGKPCDNRTLNQKAQLKAILSYLKSKYKDAIILGHRDFKGVKKSCLCFDAKKEYSYI